MSFIHSPDQLPSITLSRDVTKHLKRGHLWAFSTCFDEKQTFTSGLHELYYKKELLGLGVVQADSQLRFRMFCLADSYFYKKNSAQKTLALWSQQQWRKALSIRKNFNLDTTNSFRLLNGEGDGTPGLVIDIYQNVAVIKHDHVIMETVWNRQEIAEQLKKDLPQLDCVYFKRKNDNEEKGVNLIGTLPPETIFRENGLMFSSNIRDAAKTGFFLDQRDNRELVGKFSQGLEVLNLFSYTGGFSISAAAGGAKKVTSVDIAKAAILAVDTNFKLNNFTTEHEDIAADAFDYVDQQILLKSKYDLVITDPPSFAPNEKSVPQATAAYIKIYSNSIKLVKDNGTFAASSCSSHISTEDFLEICREAFSKARKRGVVIHLGAQPIDHPYPLAMPELRYLKFALFRVES
jgi:23S rRNA (cytosine1962-C5)-methyltransferase